MRNSAAEALGVILKIVGEKGMSVYLEGIDKTKSEKVSLKIDVDHFLKFYSYMYA